MGYIANLNDLEGRKGIFSILLTATILTVFEIVFFYKIVAPSIDKQMNDGIDDVSTQLVDSVSGQTGKLKIGNAKFFIEESMNHLGEMKVTEKTDGVMATLAGRDDANVAKINRYTKFTGVLIISMLLILLFVLRTSIKGSTGDTSLKTPVWTAIVSVGALIGFQVMFYFFGQNFKYPGSLGTEEFLSVVFEAIKAK